MEGCSRRDFLDRCLTAASSAVGVLAMGSCGKKKDAVENAPIDAPVSSCEDMSQVSEEDLAVRNKLGYVKESPIADNQCENCNLFLPPKGQEPCGGCMLIKGPVYLTGYCTYWAPKV
jgi:hypothetical protein